MEEKKSVSQAYQWMNHCQGKCGTALTNQETYFAKSW